MKVTLKANALEINAERSSDSEKCSFGYDNWCESVSEMLQQGGEFNVNTGMLAPDKFCVLRENDFSVEIPAYMVETVIDDVRQFEFTKLILKRNAIGVEQEQTNDSVKNSPEHLSWCKSISEMLQDGGEFEIYYASAERFHVFLKNGSQIEIPMYLVDTLIQSDGFEYHND